jgi:hypothetical protein
MVFHHRRARASLLLKIDVGDSEGGALDMPLPTPYGIWESPYGMHLARVEGGCGARTSACRIHTRVNASSLFMVFTRVRAPRSVAGYWRSLRENFLLTSGQNSFRTFEAISTPSCMPSFAAELAALRLS